LAFDNAGQEEAPLATLNVKRAGFDPSDVIEVAVNPIGLPSGSMVVIIATPEACRLKAAFSASLGSVFSSFCNIVPKVSFSFMCFNQIDWLNNSDSPERSSSMTDIRFLDLRGVELSERVVEKLIPRAQIDISEAALEIEPLVKRVRVEGLSAIRAITTELDGFDPDPVLASEIELSKALDAMDEGLRASIELAIERIRKVSTETMPAERVVELEKGAFVSERFVPVDSVGVYVPGGKAVYPSSLIMSVVPAQVAGVQEIIICTPGQREFAGRAHPSVLATAKLLGVEKVFVIGGPIAIATMAFGVLELELNPVRLITGPGNIFVAAAKRLVRGAVAIDSEAGTTEIMILADESSNPVFLAADLISQAEHDEAAAAVLVTDSLPLIERVMEELSKQLENAVNKERARSALSGKQSALVLVNNLSEALRVANFYASEHLSLQISDSENLVAEIKNAGAIFVGEYSPVSLGDYLAGSNHVLPTGGAAKNSSGLSVHTFLRCQQVISYDEKVLKGLEERLVSFAEAEGLPAHGEAVRRRFSRD
jgi:histidinol dehydrogenase